MFCPKCGKSDQSPETYCRQCGVFLPNFDKVTKKEAPPEENIKVNTVLSMMTVIVSFALAALLYIFLGFRETTHPLIYLTAGLLIAMGGWHIQTFIRARRLRKQWKRRIEIGKVDDAAARGNFMAPTTDKLLEPPDFQNMEPATITDQTTRQLVDTKTRSS